MGYHHKAQGVLPAHMDDVGEFIVPCRRRVDQGSGAWMECFSVGPRRAVLL